MAHAFWQHDGSASVSGGVGFGNNFVVLGVLVDVPFMTRTVCLPVLFRLYTKSGPERSELANRLVWIVSSFLDSGRAIEVVADAAYACERLPVLADIARDRRRRWRTVWVTRYGRRETLQALTLTCLWYKVFKQRPVRVVLLREVSSAKPFDVALVATDTSATIEQIIERYAQRWAIEVAFRDAKQTAGVGEARNRTALAVQRTVPFGLLVQSLVAIWYANAGHTTAVVAARRRLAPWYDHKTEPSWLDMVTTLRRQLIADRFRALPHPAVDHAEIHDPAWILELIAS